MCVVLLACGGEASTCPDCYYNANNTRLCNSYECVGSVAAPSGGCTGYRRVNAGCGNGAVYYCCVCPAGTIDTGSACAATTPSPSASASASRAAAAAPPASVACGVAQQSYAATAACPAGQVITAVTFASYGLPAIISLPGCAFAANAACAAPAAASAAVVSAACVGRAACAVLAADATFSGAPCAGTKNLAFAVVCGAAATPGVTRSPQSAAATASRTASAAATASPSGTASASRTAAASPSASVAACDLTGTWVADIGGATAITQSQDGRLTLAASMYVVNFRIMSGSGYHSATSPMFSFVRTYDGKTITGNVDASCSIMTLTCETRMTTNSTACVPISQTWTRVAYADSPGMACVGGDFNAGCGMAAAPDVVSLTLPACKALCAADAACAGVVSYATGGCWKKCVGGWTPVRQPLSTCAFIPARMRQSPLPTLPAQTQSPSPTLAPTLAAGRFFTPTGAYQTFVVPAGSRAVDVELWGAGGGTLQPPAYGGAGAYVAGTLPVTPGETLRVIVGVAGGGRGGGPAGAGTDAGGGGGAGFIGNATAASGGGGRTAVQRFIAGLWTDVVSAGGGGGGCFSYGTVQPVGGAATWNGTAARGTDSARTTAAAGGGGGGGAAAGGESAQAGAPAGAATKGGAACPACAGFGSGGGGGAFGGGSGGCGGGGGGSSLTANLVAPASGASGSAALPFVAGGSASPFYVAALAPGNADVGGLAVLKAEAPCDARGRCYVGILAPAGGFTQSAARARCMALGTGWDLPAIVDTTTRADVLGGLCRGTLPATTPFWLGLIDSSPGTRALSTANRNYGGWKWTSAAANPASYFLTAQASSATTMWGSWGDIEPNNKVTEFCVHVYPKHAYTINDLACTRTANWEDSAPFGACCQQLLSNATSPSPAPQSSSPSAAASASATTSRATSASPSTSASGSRKVSPVAASPSPSVSPSLSRSRSRAASAIPSESRSGSVTASGSGSLSSSRTGSGSASASQSTAVSPLPSPSSSGTPSPSCAASGTPTATASPLGTPAPAQQARCGNGTSVQTVTVSGTLLVSTPAVAGTVNLACSWVVTAPAGSVVTLSLLAFSAQPQIDFLSVFDGNSASSPPFYYQVTGGGAAPQPVTSTGHSLYVWFLSTAYFSSKGVIAVVSFSPASALLPMALAPQPQATDGGGGTDVSIPLPVGFRCGPGVTSGAINTSGAVFYADPALPAFGALSPVVDCTVTVAAPPGSVAVVSYLHYSLAPALDFWSVFDGSNAGATPLVYMASGAIAGAANSTILPPVLVSSGQFLLLRFQSVDFAPGVGRGVAAAITFVDAPRSALPAAATAGAGDGGVGSALGAADSPLACTAVGMAMRPWDAEPNPAYPLAAGAVCSLPPALIAVGALAGSTVTLGWQAAGASVTLRDGVSYAVTLANCARNCSVADTPAAAAGGAPDSFRQRDGCGFSGTCPFLWAWTDAAGTLLAPPARAMATPVVVPASAAYLTLGYSQTNYCAASGAAAVCLFSAPVSPSAAPPSATPAATPTASPLPSAAVSVIIVTLTVTGPDASVCATSAPCVGSLVNAAAAAVVAASPVTVLAGQVVAAGSGAPPALAALGLRSSRQLAAGAAARSLATMPAGAFPGSGAAIDALSAALLSAVSSDPAAPLWAILSFAIAADGARASRQLQAAAADAIVAAVSAAAASGALTAAFAASLSDEIDAAGEAAPPALVAYLQSLAAGGATAALASSAVQSVGGVTPTAEPGNGTDTIAAPAVAATGLSAGAIVGIVLAGVVVAGLVAAAVFVHRRRVHERKPRPIQQRSAAMPVDDGVFYQEMIKARASAGSPRTRAPTPAVLVVGGGATQAMQPASRERVQFAAAGVFPPLNAVSYRGPASPSVITRRQSGTIVAPALPAPPLPFAVYSYPSTVGAQLRTTSVDGRTAAAYSPSPATYRR